MDVVLGVAVTGPVARLALVGAGAGGSDVIDQSVVDLANNPIQQLTETVVGTNRLLANDNHRLVGTRLCWTDHPSADQLRRALEDSGVHNVAVLSESQAVTALMRAAGRTGGALVVDDNTATLSVVGAADGDPDAPPTMLASELLGGDATGTLDTMMARLGEHPDAHNDVFLVGSSSDLAGVADQLRDATMRVQIPEDPTFALARGAAIAAAPVTGESTAMAPAGFGDPPAADEQLAYSMADDDDDLLPGEYDEFDDFYDDDPDAETGPLKLSRRSLLVGNAVIAFAVIGVASLAVAVVVAVRPTAAQQPVIGHQNAAPGKFMPLLPTQQQAPVPPPPPEAPNAGYQGGVIPAPAVPQAPAPGVGPAPAPGAPVAPVVPGLVPNPNGPIPIPVPIIIPYPGWRPQPPWYPTYTPPTTTTYTPTTTPTTSPPTTPTTPTTPPTTTPYTPITPTTTVAPTTTPYTPITPTTTVAPTTVAPTEPTQTQQTQTQTQTQQTQTVQPTQTQPTQTQPPTVQPTQQPTVQPTQQPAQQPTQQTVAPKPPTQQQTVAPKPPPQTVAPRAPSGGGGGHSSSGS
ncbi:hypothetical protein AWC29_17660 [Mycobacterium triplex]|uniref:FHA domain-containing protein n=1 Tax=Mycobacterium triplex TaxID=47839 RepID=A0A024JTG9_9MYCO|nr:hypothetical protein [Mycobacterium triplex]ORX03874.1 hypothetical protein AWC29_17660 [Mycobacterium triplex]CDO86884.1 FHA domain-containing protein [Mycobacterium triplex]